MKDHEWVIYGDLRSWNNNTRWVVLSVNPMHLSSYLEQISILRNEYDSEIYSWVKVLTLYSNVNVRDSLSSKAQFLQFCSTRDNFSCSLLVLFNCIIPREILRKVPAWKVMVHCDWNGYVKGWLCRNKNLRCGSAFKSLIRCLVLRGLKNNKVVVVVVVVCWLSSWLKKCLYSVGVRGFFHWMICITGIGDGGFPALYWCS